MLLEINDYLQRVRRQLMQKGAWDHCKANVSVVGMFVPPGYDLIPGHSKLALSIEGEEEDVAHCHSEIMRYIASQGGEGAKYKRVVYELSA